MPTSDAFQISAVLNLVIQFDPKSILDVGVGFGKWGMLCREYLDVWYGRYERDEWKVRIDGVEAFEDYRNPVHDHCYNQIYYVDIMSRLDMLPKYDLILLIDMIEHLEKERGKRLLESLRSHYIICTPQKFHSWQATPFGNKYETHRSIWFASDFGNSRLVGEQILAWQ